MKKFDRQRRPRWLTTAAACCLVCASLMVAACGDDDSSSTTASGGDPKLKGTPPPAFDVPDPDPDVCKQVTKNPDGTLTVPMITGREGPFVAPLAYVCVNGKGPFVFIIDTGSPGVTIFRPALAEKLGLKRGKEQEAPAVGCSSRLYPSRAPGMSLAGVPIGGSEISIADHKCIHDGIQGNLGVTALGQFGSVRIDFDEEKLTLAHSARPIGKDRELKPSNEPLPESLVASGPEITAPFTGSVLAGTYVVGNKVTLGDRRPTDWSADTGAWRTTARRIGSG